MPDTPRTQTELATSAMRETPALNFAAMLGGLLMGVACAVCYVLIARRVSLQFPRAAAANAAGLNPVQRLKAFENAD